MQRLCKKARVISKMGIQLKTKKSCGPKRGEAIRRRVSKNTTQKERASVSECHTQPSRQGTALYNDKETNGEFHNLAFLFFYRQGLALCVMAMKNPIPTLPLTKGGLSTMERW